MPPGRQKHVQIDGTKHPPYMPGHELTRREPFFCPAPPSPYRHGTDARSRVISFVPPVPRPSS
jgi:hypothetical protein